MKPYFLKKEAIFAVPVIHYNMETAICVKKVFDLVQPDCVAVELPESFQNECLHAASRLPDISLIQGDSLKILVEPCDGTFEAIRSALEHGINAYCIDLDVKEYPLFNDALPDPYAITHIGLQTYYETYVSTISALVKHDLDVKRELYMARRLKELSLQYEKVLFVCGFFHLSSILNFIHKNSFPSFDPEKQQNRRVSALTEESSRDVMAEFGWISYFYEKFRENGFEKFLDRQRLIYQLYKTAAKQYHESTGLPFLGYHLNNTMKFVRNYAHIHNRLMPNLFEILSAAKGCVDHNFAYEVWLLATSYAFRQNIDNLQEENPSIEEIWGNSKLIRFHLKQRQRKGLSFQKRKKDIPNTRFSPPSPFSICSYPPEDIVIENFGDFLKRKGTLLLSEETGRTLPFTTSLEDGIDIRETIRHFYEQKLYVRMKGRNVGGVGSVVIIFDEDAQNEDSLFQEKYPWKTTWHGEHNQESDMAFYATDMFQKVVGPGISRCNYGGFLMSYPPRRLYDVWADPDYYSCQSKAEVLLMSAIDYALKPNIVYVAEKPPRSKIKSFANRFGKKIIYIPIGGLSPILLNKIRVFHVLDGYDKREIAGDYIF